MAKAHKIQISISNSFLNTLRALAIEHDIVSGSSDKVMDATAARAIIIRVLKSHSSQEMRALKKKKGGTTLSQIDEGLKLLYKKEGVE